MLTAFFLQKTAKMTNSDYPLRKYLEETPMHGFGFVATAPNKYELIAWILLILACIGVMISDTVLLVAKFNSEPTATEFTVKFNSTMSFYDKSTLCVDVDTAAVKRDANLNLNEVVKQIEAFDQGNGVETINQYASFQNHLIPEMPDLLFKLTYLFLVDIEQSEKNFFGGFTPLNAIPWGYVTNRSNKSAIAEFNSTLNEGMFKVYQYFMKKKIDIDALYPVIGAIMCEKLNISVTFMN